MKRRIAIAGFGFMGRMHYSVWSKMKGASVTALCDADLSQFKAAAKGNIAGADQTSDFSKVALFSDFEQMLDEARPDAVSITLPTPLHLPYTLAALKRGVHVLCEKPMARNTKECKAMLAGAVRAPKGTHLAIAHCLRFWPAYVYLKQLVDSKKYGAVVAASFDRLSALPGWCKGNWLQDENKSGGMGLDLHIHDTDMVQHLFGLPESVVSSTHAAPTGLVNHQATLYAYADKVVSASASWAMPDSFGFGARYVVTFEKAAVVFDTRAAEPLTVFPQGKKPFVPKIPAGDGYEHEIRWFLKLISGQSVEKTVTPESSYESVRLVEAESKAAKTGRRVFL